ncbi:hypothetical protein C1646_672976 [Rhizophagus diaphanus]|nr:hypothetical protein C1646_672976 [Rhizophagus diaphanus] [Rhizophagus sp. MUCL 43196]
MSSYNTETKTGLPVKYLKYTKESLWEKFSYQFPDGVKRTSFMTFLQGKQYIYQENLGGLHEIFVEIKNFIEKNIQNNNLQIAHSIIRHVKLGFDISSGKDIENCNSGICGTSVSHLEQNRKKGLDNTNYLSSHDPCSDKGKSSANTRFKLLVIRSHEMIVGETFVGEMNQTRLKKK